MAKQRMHSIQDWPVVRILEVLFAQNISAPVCISHESVFKFLLEANESELVATAEPPG